MDYPVWLLSLVFFAIGLLIGQVVDDLGWFKSILFW